MALILAILFVGILIYLGLSSVAFAVMGGKRFRVAASLSIPTYLLFFGALIAGFMEAY